MAESHESALKEWIKGNRAQQPALGAEMVAVFRQGREDAWNKLIPAFPDQQYNREAGAPGTPTPQQVTESLTGQDVDRQTDQIAKDGGVHGVEGQEHTRGR